VANAYDAPPPSGRWNSLGSPSRELRLVTASGAMGLPVSSSGTIGGGGGGGGGARARGSAAAAAAQGTDGSWDDSDWGFGAAAGEGDGVIRSVPVLLWSWGGFHPIVFCRPYTNFFSVWSVSGRRALLSSPCPPLFLSVMPRLAPALPRATPGREHS